MNFGLSMRNVIFKLIEFSMPTGWIKVDVQTCEGALKFYTHQEGVQVIDELAIMGQYGLVGIFHRMPIHVVIDVGAHIGVFTVIAAKSIKKLWEKGIIISVEPSSVNFWLLLKVVKRWDVRLIWLRWMWKELN